MPGRAEDKEMGWRDYYRLLETKDIHARAWEVAQKRNPNNPLDALALAVSADSKKAAGVILSLVAERNGLIESLGRVADALCTCEWLLPSYSALDPAGHRPECPYRLAATRPEVEDFEEETPLTELQLRRIEIGEAEVSA
jgi:hypothetical protein